jgi:CheY-like chemotaxis protein
MTSRRVVLIVDDVEATRTGLAKLLRLKGYDTHEAHNGAEALTLLRLLPGIRVVVLDVWMPDTDGFWFRKQQLLDPLLAEIPVVVFTGAPNGLQLAKQMHVEDVLLKPFSIDRLCAAIERHCRA